MQPFEQLASDSRVLLLRILAALSLYHQRKNMKLSEARAMTIPGIAVSGADLVASRWTELAMALRARITNR